MSEPVRGVLRSVWKNFCDWADYTFMGRKPWYHEAKINGNNLPPDQEDIGIGSTVLGNPIPKLKIISQNTYSITPKSLEHLEETEAGNTVSLIHHITEQATLGQH